MPLRNGCPFCGFPDKEVVFYEDSLCLGIVSKAPLNKYHGLIVPKEHYTDSQRVPDEILVHLYLVSKKVAQAIAKACNPDGITMVHDDGLNKTVEHFTIHIIPRFRGDKIGGFYLREEDPGLQARATYATRIRECLG